MPFINGRRLFSDDDNGADEYDPMDQLNSPIEFIDVADIILGDQRVDPTGIGDLSYGN